LHTRAGAVERESQNDPIKAGLPIKRKLAVRGYGGLLHKEKETMMVKRTRGGLLAALLFSAGSIGASSIAQAQTGIASVYAGGITASGEKASARGMTAAHRTLPFGTRVRVTCRRSGRSVVVRINDRGPFVRGRVIDVTPAAARALGFSGLSPVTLQVVHGHH
jgi:peptidoglycan lytic transglycosylase